MLCQYQVQPDVRPEPAHQVLEGGFESSVGQEVLKHCLIPKLLLPDVQNLRGTCKALRSAVDSANPGLWTSVVRYSADCWDGPAAQPRQLHSAVALTAWLRCRQSLPAGHPLCSVAPRDQIPQHADSLARLHSSIRAGSGKQATLTIRTGPLSEGLDAVANPQGASVCKSSCALHAHEA